MSHLDRGHDHSTLEVVPHERAANAPELDYASATGLQVDNSSVNPEVVRSAGQPEQDEIFEGKEIVINGKKSTSNRKGRVLGLPYFIF